MGESAKVNPISIVHSIFLVRLTLETNNYRVYDFSVGSSSHVNEEKPLQLCVHKDEKSWIDAKRGCPNTMLIDPRLCKHPILASNCSQKGGLISKMWRLLHLTSINAHLIVHWAKKIVFFSVEWRIHSCPIKSKFVAGDSPMIGVILWPCTHQKRYIYALEVSEILGFSSDTEF